MTSIVFKLIFVLFIFSSFCGWRVDNGKQWVRYALNLGTVHIINLSRSQNNVCDNWRVISRFLAFFRAFWYEVVFSSIFYCVWFRWMKVIYKLQIVTFIEISIKYFECLIFWILNWTQCHRLRLCGFIRKIIYNFILSIRSIELDDFFEMASIWKMQKSSNAKIFKERHSYIYTWIAISVEPHWYPDSFIQVNSNRIGE